MTEQNNRRTALFFQLREQGADFESDIVPLFDLQKAFRPRLFGALKKGS